MADQRQMVASTGNPSDAATTTDVTATASALIVSAADKAGMDGIDRAKIDSIILRESADSNYMKQQRKRDAAVNERIERMRQRLAEHGGVGGSWREAQERALQPEIDRLMADRRSLSTCVVVDMDAFYMSCELLTRPDLKNVPACVGKGMILTSNYCARRYGVRSAMAGWIGDKLVEELSEGKQRLVHVPSNFDLYTKKAHEVRTVLAEFDPKMRAYSLDECYMDIGPYLSLRIGKGWQHEQVVATLSQADCKPAANTGSNEEDESDDDYDDDNDDDNTGGDTQSTSTDLGDLEPDAALEAAAAIVDEMRKKVKEATGLSCSAGLAGNFMLAKISSDFNKPDGQCIVGPSNESILRFLRPLKVRRVPGIGRVTEKVLNAFDITTVEELYDQRALVQFLFSGQATARFLLQRSLGWSNSDSKTDDDEGSESAGQKGISKERTFQPGKTWTEINSKLEDIALSLSEAMRRKNLFAHTITLKCKLHTFDVLTRSKSMARGIYLQKAQEMIPIVAQILADLKREHKGGIFSVRLLGIRCHNFRDEGGARLPDIQAFLTKKTAGTKCSELPDIGDTSEQKSSDVGSKPMATSVSSPYRSSTAAAAAAKSSPRRNILASPPATTSRLPAPAATMQATTCPICSNSIPGDNIDLNRHIDSCLNASTIRQLAKDESTAADESERAKKRRHILKDFFNT